MGDPSHGKCSLPEWTAKIDSILGFLVLIIRVVELVHFLNLCEHKQNPTSLSLCFTEFLCTQAVQRGLASLQTGWHLGTFCLLLVCALEIHEKVEKKLKSELLPAHQQWWLLLQHCRSVVNYKLLVGLHSHGSYLLGTLATCSKHVLGGS